jgi:histidinol phosphatase-like enzyme
MGLVKTFKKYRDSITDVLMIRDEVRDVQDMENAAEQTKAVLKHRTPRASRRIGMFGKG